jgi:adenine specific DNA methylase Mod
MSLEDPNSARSVGSTDSDYNEEDYMINDIKYSVSIVDNQKRSKPKSIFKTPTTLCEKKPKRIRWNDNVTINYTKTHYTRNPNSLLSYRFWSHSMSKFLTFCSNI